MKELILKDKATGKTYGVVIGDTFHKRVDSRIHRFRKLNAYGIQQNVLDFLQDNGVQFVQVEETDTGNIYLAALADYIRRGVPIDEGHGQQVMLPLKYFEHVKSPHLAMF